MSSASIESALAAEEPIESRLCAPHNRYRDGAPPPGIFWLFAIGEPLSATSIARTGPAFLRRPCDPIASR